MLRDLIRQWLDADLSDEKLLRQDWITGETLFLRSLAFRALQPECGLGPSGRLLQPVDQIGERDRAG